MKLELRSVRIKNCGPIDDLKLDFFDATGKTLPVCVIGGVNGSGKTTIIESITALAEIFEDGRWSVETDSPISNPTGYLQTDWRFGETEVSVFRGSVPSNVQLCQDYLGQRLQPVGNNFLTSTEQTEGLIELTLKFDLKRNRSLTNWTNLSPTEKQPTIIYLPHNRSLEPVFGEEIRKEEDTYQFVYCFETVRQFPGSLTSYLIWLDYAEPERYAEIQQFLNDLDFDGKTFRVDRKSLSVVVKTASGHEHPLHELSSGEQNLLIILIELRRKLTPGSIVLIDEIENSLHPAFQHRLAQGLLALQREVPYQLIVTTHAPAFVEIFGAENTRLLTAF